MSGLRQKHLVIFARYPQLGRGKRRLAKGAGDVAAVHFQRVRLHVLIHRLSRDPRWRTYLAVTPNRSGPWPAHVTVLAQGQGDLGMRMTRVMEALPPGPAVIIGSDVPGVTRVAVADAFKALPGHDAVFGPAGDGGYWLVGLSRSGRRFAPFSPVRWSSEWALADTIANLNGARITMSRALDDVDTADDLTAAIGWSRVIAPVSPPFGDAVTF
jgi:uncharacterized protein